MPRALCQGSSRVLQGSDEYYFSDLETPGGSFSSVEIAVMLKIPSFLQGSIFILDTIPITALLNAMDLEAARLEECDDEVLELLDEDESAALVEKIRRASIQ